MIQPPAANLPSVNENTTLPEDFRSLDGEVNVPFNGMGNKQTDALEERRKSSAARRTDAEVVTSSRAKGLSDLNQALNVSAENSNTDKPSFTRGIQKVKSLFKAYQYEESLIQVNELLVHYPSEPKLYLMKGSIHQRTGHLDLALTAFEKAFDFEPSTKLKNQLDYLRLQITEREKLRRPIKGVVVPEGVQSMEAIPGDKK